MSDDARDLIRSIRTEQQLALFASRLRTWLLTSGGEEQREVHEDQDFPESRARALLRAAAMVDDATLTDFARIVARAGGLRLALYDLLVGSDLASHDEIQALAVVASRKEPSETEVAWLSLALSSYAWKRGYSVGQLDPASPPERFSPAGQVVANTSAFLRHQIQRGATERDRLARPLQPRDGAASTTLDDLRAEGSIPPLPPHFRAPIPVRYPEIARDTLRVVPAQEADERPVSRGDSLVITEEDLAGERREQRQPPIEQDAPLRMPPLQISRDQVQPSQPPSPLPPSAVVMPASSSDSRPGLTVAIRQMFGPEALSSTKLRVVAQAYPDGPGMYGLQVKVTCKGIKSFVAGTTDREGRFLAELPVKRQEGLTYDVDLTWPRDMGGETERKSMTLHADRTEFVLPFYRRLEPRVETDEQGTGE